MCTENVSNDLWGEIHLDPLTTGNWDNFLLQWSKKVSFFSQLRDMQAFTLTYLCISSLIRLFHYDTWIQLFRNSLMMHKIIKCSKFWLCNFRPKGRNILVKFVAILSVTLKIAAPRCRNWMETCRPISDRFQSIIHCDWGGECWWKHEKTGEGRCAEQLMWQGVGFAMGWRGAMGAHVEGGNINMDIRMTLD